MMPLTAAGSIGSQRLVAALPPRTRATPGTDVTLSLDTEALHLFDAESGRRLSAD